MLNRYTYVLVHNTELQTAVIIGCFPSKSFQLVIEDV